MEKIIWLCFLLFLVIIGSGCLCLFIVSRQGVIPATGKKPEKKYDAVTFHSYKPPGGRVPERGKRVVRAAVDWARHYGCAIVLSVGYTVRNDPRMESEIYAQYIHENIDGDIPIITGRNGCVRDTAREVKSTFIFCLTMGYKNVCVAGAYPHLASRIKRYWSRVNKDERLAVTFVGVRVQPRIYLWELAMWLTDVILLPPGTRRREFFLGLIGRRG